MKLIMRKRGTAKFRIYLYKQCARAKQEGTILMKDPQGNEEQHFDHLDEIPGCIRSLLATKGLRYEVARASDDTVIDKKTRRRRVIGKTRKQ